MIRLINVLHYSVIFLLIIWFWIFVLKLWVMISSKTCQLIQTYKIDLRLILHSKILKTFTWHVGVKRRFLPEPLRIDNSIIFLFIFWFLYLFILSFCVWYFYVVYCFILFFVFSTFFLTFYMRMIITIWSKFKG